MNFLKRAFSSCSSSTIKPTNLNRIMEKTEPIDVMIRNFISNPNYDTHVDIYATCYKHIYTHSTKIILKPEVYDSFKSTIDDYGKYTKLRILVEPLIAFLTITVGVNYFPPDIFTISWFMVGLVAEYKFMAFLSREDTNIYHRQQFLQDFFNNKIEKYELLHDVTAENLPYYGTPVNLSHSAAQHSIDF